MVQLSKLIPVSLADFLQLHGQNGPSYLADAHHPRRSDRSVLGRASLTARILPAAPRPLIAAIALSPSASLSISTRQSLLVVPYPDKSRCSPGQQFRMAQRVNGHLALSYQTEISNVDILHLRIPYACVQSLTLTSGFACRHHHPNALLSGGLH